jgi:hypothetical protein
MKALSHVCAIWSQLSSCPEAQVTHSSDLQGWEACRYELLGGELEHLTLKGTTMMATGCNPGATKPLSHPRQDGSNVPDVQSV